MACSSLNGLGGFWPTGLGGFLNLPKLNPPERESILGTQSLTSRNEHGLKCRILDVTLIYSLKIETPIIANTLNKVIAKYSLTPYQC